MARFESPSVSITPRGSAAAGGDAECTVVWLQGEHDAANKAFLAATLTRAAELEGADVLVDLGAVTFMDASTIGVIIGARNRMRMGARSLAIRTPSPPALRVLELCGLTHLVSPTPFGALGTWVEVPSSPSTRDSAQAPEALAPRAAALSELDGGRS